MNPAVLKEIIRFETQRYLRDRITWLAGVALVVLLVVGAVDYWNSLPPRPDGSRLFSEAYFLGLCLAFHAWVAQDRTTRFDAFLASNFVRPQVLYFGKVISALLFLLGLAVTSFALALLTSLGNFEYAARYSVMFLAGSILLLPVVILAELGLPTRYPVSLILIFLFAVMAVLQKTGDLPGFIRTLGLDGHLSPGEIALRTAAAVLFTAAFYPLYRLRLGLKR